MSTKTTNYELIKPELNDAADITMLNGNFDTIDNELKLVNDAIDEIDNDLNIKTYTTLSQLGLSGAVTLQDVCDKLPAYSTFRMPNRKGTGSYVSDVPQNYGTLTINTCDAGGYINVNFIQSDSNNIIEYNKKYTSSHGWSDWVTTFNQTNKPTAQDVGALSTEGGVLSGELTVMDNLNVNKTFDGTEYKTYIRPINYSVANNGDYTAALLLYKGTTNQAQLMFNKDGVMLRDNVNGKAYKLFGQHFLPTPEQIGIIYSETQPSGSAGKIWLKPI